MNRKPSDFSDAGWYVFAGCTLIGFGIGIAADAAIAGLIIGAGVGFLAMVAAPFLNK